MGIKYQTSIDPVILDQEGIELVQEELLGKKMKTALMLVFFSIPIICLPAKCLSDD